MTLEVGNKIDARDCAKIDILFADGAKVLQ
jgi:hypothetical protein